MQLSIPPSQMDMPTLILSDSLSEPGIRWSKHYWRRISTSLHNLTDRGGLTTDPELSVAHKSLLCDATIRPVDESLRTSLSGLVPIPIPFPISRVMVQYLFSHSFSAHLPRSSFFLVLCLVVACAFLATNNTWTWHAGCD